MKLGIVIPLKSRLVSNNWSTTCDNLSSTVRSVLSQKNDNYEAVVVGHDRPDFFDELDPERKQKCQFVTFDEYTPPFKGEDEIENQLKYEFDRCIKILKGVIFLAKEFPDITHWFALDADDLVRNDFVDVIAKYQNYDAVILERGFSYFKSTGVINIENEFSAYCGSSSIMSNRLMLPIPKVIDEKGFRSIPFGGISHVHMKQKLIDRGFSVAIPEDRVIMYVRDNGENISNDAYCNTWLKKTKKSVKMLIKAKRVDKRVKEAFGVS